jgi:hypothetical protein
VFQKPRDEPPVISNGRWQTGRDATEIEHPTKGHDISGG